MNELEKERENNTQLSFDKLIDKLIDLMLLSPSSFGQNVGQDVRSYEKVKTVWGFSSFVSEEGKIINI